MIDPIAAQSLVSPLVRPEFAQPAAALPMVNAADQARFQEALRPLPDTLLAAAPTRVTPELRVAAPLTPGDAILHSLDKMRNGYRELGVTIESMGRKADLSPGALLNLQIQVSQVTLNTQLIQQVASKVEQDMNSLLKGS